MEGNAVHWFSKGLRLHDNPSLKEAISGSATFRGIFFLDKDTVQGSTASPNRWRFLLESLRDLDRSLQRFNSRLFVIKGNPIQVLPRLLKQWNINKLTFQYDSEPFSQRRDVVVRRLAEKLNVKVVSKTSHTLYDVKKVLASNGNKPPCNFQRFQSIIEQLPPEECVPPVDEELFASCVTPLEENHEELYGIPNFADLGLDPALERGSGVWLGGETEALRRLEVTHHCEPPPSLFQSLLWREFFFTLGSTNIYLDCVENNSICINIPWEDQADRLAAWKEARTGFPWIDAIMRQLNQEGWIHHLARQAVGCFLTRGCMWVCWEEGNKVFEQTLLDSEWSLNAGSWLSLSCSAFFDKFPTWFCPVNAGRRLDPSGAYVRKYVPELKAYPDEYIYEPWKAPLDVQQASGCVIGTTYPGPILDHKEARNICVGRMRDLFKTLVTKVSGKLQSGQNVIHWFRKDLRLHDNPALREALNGCQTIYGIYVLDPSMLKASSESHNQAKFLLESLADLDRSLQACGTRLYVIREQLTNVLPKLFKEWNITKITFEADDEPYGQQRDLAVSLIAEDHGVEVVSRTSHTLFNPSAIVEANGGNVPVTFEDFEKVLKGMSPPPKPVKPVTRKAFASTLCPVYLDHDEKYGIPDLSAWKKESDAHSPFTGGEHEALQRLKQLEEKVMGCKKEEVAENVLYPSGTQLSPYLRFGCISSRLYYHRLTMAYMKMNSQPPPLSFYRHLTWREFFFTLGSQNQHLDKMRDNPFCLQIPWEADDSALERWKTGRTGFPWIDAVMRQLKQEGWVHHIARQTVGCFLTRGCLWINWEEGFKFFEKSQLDAEWSVNACCWMWLSCSAFFHGKVPWYCPVSVGKKMDPTGNYARKYVPELRTMPTKYIYEPWLAPTAIQEAAKCVVGRDYPERMVDHVERREVCLERLKILAEDLQGMATD